MPSPSFWSPEFRANQVSTGDRDNVRVTALKDGSFVAVWSSIVAGMETIKGRVFDTAGQPRTSEFDVNTTAIVKLSQTPDIAIEELADGRFVVAWDTYADDFATTGLNVRARIFNADGTPYRRAAEGSNDFIVNAANSVGQQINPSIVALPNGGFVISFEDDSRAGSAALNDVQAQTYGADGLAVGPLGRAVSPSELGQQFGSVSVALNNGTYLVLYNELESNIYTVRGHIFGTGDNAISTFTALEQADEGFVQMRVDALAGGRFVVTWRGNDGSNLGVRAKIFEADGSAAKDVFTVNSTTAGYQGYADVVALPDGGFAVAYEDLSEGPLIIRLTTFDSNGNRVGDEIRVSAPDAPWHYEPRLAALADGRLVVSYAIENGTQDQVGARIVDARFSPVDLKGTSSDDHYFGTGFGDRLSGAAGADRLHGEAGNDYLDGGTGADVLDGGLGDDTYVVNGADQLTDAGGIDTVMVTSSYTLAAGFEALTGSGAVGLTLTGSGLANTLTGTGAKDRLKGDAGNDTMQGGAGADTLLGDLGNDHLTGGLGRDTMTGGRGRDVFAFDDRETGGSTRSADYLTDFSGRQRDKIDLKLVDANTRKRGDQKFSFIGDEEFTGVGQVRYEKVGKQTYVYLNTDADLTPEAVIRLKGAMDLSKGWFVL